MNIQELKQKSSEQLIDEAEKLGIENASTLRRQEIYFAISESLITSIPRGFKLLIESSTYFNNSPKLL